MWEEWCGLVKQWGVLIIIKLYTAISVCYYGTNVTLWTNIPHFHIDFFFFLANLGMNLVIWTLIQVKVSVSDLDQHPGRLPGTLWICIPVFSSRWIFCGVNFLCLYMAYLGRVSQTFSELFNPKLVLSLYTGINVLKGSLKVSWCTNHMIVNITLIFTMLEHPG